MDLSGVLACLLLALSALIAPAGAQERGYQARACGFDMNRDGVAGGSGDCNVCDGSGNDGDGDGSAADVIYVSCAGDPGTPYTFLHAWCRYLRLRLAQLPVPDHRPRLCHHRRRSRHRR